MQHSVHHFQTLNSELRIFLTPNGKFRCSTKPVKPSRTTNYYITLTRQHLPQEVIINSVLMKS